ncbi:hypothetical protein ElyMa_003889700 [Elysia marginata]|uniref:Uncharacterized protein n=1 Tax=Elysia marginata TaxID=1093978 RepID=A0AAV4FM14_9GAST|nr:hypothetical protein ElyMa_003889700 [Elysia marginata]
MGDTATYCPPQYSYRVLLVVIIIIIAVVVVVVVVVVAVVVVVNVVVEVVVVAIAVVVETIQKGNEREKLVNKLLKQKSVQDGGPPGNEGDISLPWSPARCLCESFYVFYSVSHRKVTGLPEILAQIIAMCDVVLRPVG